MYIYIHIPFCTSICSYCDFPKLLYDKKYTNKYLEALKEEILQRYKNEEVVSLYIGGGTPTSLDIRELEKLLKITNILNKNADLEFTIESNIESLDEEKIKLLKKYGINRISLGVQSLNNDNLKYLNRKHTKEDVINTINLLKKNNFNNISIDYIYGINNNLEIIKEDIDTILKLDIPHLSCYSLIIEDNTILGIRKQEYIEEEKELEMYQYIENKLTTNSYIHYEISNYAKEGYYSLHNLNYWNNGEYYGFGMGAVSYLEHERISNTLNLGKYLNHEFVSNIIKEDRNTDISNTFMLGLRKIKGINIDEFNTKYKIDILSIDVVKKLIKENKLVLNNNHLFIHPDYIYLSNEILMEFI